MAISFGSTGAKGSGTATTQALAYPATVNPGDLALACRCLWLGTVTATDESGWTNTADLSGGTGTAIDAHTTRIRVDRREAAGTEDGTSVTFDNATPSGLIGLIATYAKATSEIWSVTAATGDDATHATGRSVTASASLDLAPGDVLVAVVSNDTDTATAFTSPTFTAAGITFGSVNTRSDPTASGTNSGLDGNIGIYDASVSTGTATVAPTFALTGGPSSCGPIAFVRLRVLPTNTGTIAETIDAVTADLDGTASFEAQIHSTIADVAGDLNGTVVNPTFTGTMAASVAAVTSDIDGSVPFNATVAASVADVTADLNGTAGAPTSTGAIAASVANAVADLDGQASYEAQLHAVVADSVADLNGTNAVPTSTGALAAAVGAVAGDLNGTVLNPVTGALAASTADVAGDLNGTVTVPVFTGSMAASAAAVVGDLDGTNAAPGNNSGTMAATVQAVTADIDGTATAPVVTGSIQTSVADVVGDLNGTTAAPVSTGSLVAVVADISADLDGTFTPLPGGLIIGTLALEVDDAAADLDGFGPGRAHDGRITVTWLQ